MCFFVAVVVQELSISGAQHGMGIRKTHPERCQAGEWHEKGMHQSEKGDRVTGSPRLVHRDSSRRSRRDAAQLDLELRTSMGRSKFSIQAKVRLLTMITSGSGAVGKGDFKRASNNE